MFQISRVVITTRHGIRTPLHAPQQHTWESVDIIEQKAKQSQNCTIYYDIKFKNFSNGANGALMLCGFQQHEELGRLWLKLYGELTKNISSLRSTPYTRTILSLIAQVSQLKKDISDIEIDARNTMDVVMYSCGFLKKYKSIVMEQQDQKLSELEQLNKEHHILCDWSEYSDFFTSMKASNQTIEGYTESQIIMAKDVRNGSWKHLWHFSGYGGTTIDQYNKVLQIGIGPFVNELLNTIQDSNSKFVINSGHDCTVAPLAAVLISDSDYNGNAPGFASFLNIEIDDQQQLVQIRFRNGDQGEGDIVKLKVNEQKQCSLLDFIAYMQKFAVTEQQRHEICCSSK